MLILRHIRFAIAALLIAVPLSAFAANRPTLAEVTKVLRSSSHNQTAQATSIFPGPSGLIGAVMETGGRPGIVWLTPDLKVVIPGEVFSDTGSNLSREALRTQSVYLSPGTVLAQAVSPGAASFTVGRAGPVVTFFMDPNCIFCHAFYKQIMSPVEEGKLRVRFVMVGLIKPSSAQRSQAILSAASPAIALAKDEANFDKASEEGGFSIPSGFVPTAHIKEAVDANGKLMLKAGSQGTPTLVYCSAKTALPVMQSGVPNNFEQWLEGVGSAGHPACAE